MDHPITYERLHSYCHGADFYKPRRVSVVGFDRYGQGFRLTRFLGIDARHEYDRLRGLGYAVGVLESVYYV